MLAIDAGHGGTDSGCTSRGLVEKDLALQTALLLHALAQQCRISAALVRDADVTMGLTARAMRAAALGATQVLSVHFDSNAHTTVGRLTCYVRPGDDCALTLAEQVVRTAPPLLGPRPGLIRVTPDGWKGRAYNVLNAHALTPALLVECAFLTNSQHARYLRDAAGIPALAAGLLAALSSHSPPTNGT